MLTELIPITRDSEGRVKSGKVVARFQPANVSGYRCVSGKAWCRVDTHSFRYDENHVMYFPEAYYYWTVEDVNILQRAVMFFRGLLNR